mmetsp:Transcript_20499/g.32113  ORF Transcript_20499/g.32113 Transcript_20499/m.32113 type:complete len:440 (+) Transcript_20499:109-1428(+)|eukprot:CAMPEP_0201735268 /NCGR_PEP_ID=MMETSP0593-20130828/36591_1 /ASSEMBLY_ACC=CAM_ASM_000672 /TAXON_ID=267983 /ORGANISM="Skeletonema japonicum, Strain CCMP2506" /LENGTH=439 /DNA_ID=CAMNT_0048228787 /DNA_START=89 /DNA_END=1408 /DNA_ORIENTATION=+
MSDELESSRLAVSHPTRPQLAKLYDIHKLCTFISRLVEYEPLKCSVDTSIVATPMTAVIQRGKGNCLDLSCLIATLLVAYGYDACVVSGTAPEWIRIKDTSHMSAELVDNDVIIKDNNYTKKRCRSSPALHYWVHVKPGKRKELDGSYFVETSSGVLYPVKEDGCTSPYISIQSKLDVNEQSLIPGNVTNETLPEEAFKSLYIPNGRRTLNVDKATIQLFSGEAIDPKERVVTRMIEYTDHDKLIVEKVTEIFSDCRKNGLITRIRCPLKMSYKETFSTKNSICERYEVEGELICVKWHRKARMDGLVERVEDNIESTITENFLDRNDCLEKRVIKFAPGNCMDHSCIEEIIERFKRPEDELLDQTVASRVHSLKERKMVVTLHAQHRILRRSHTYSGATDEHVKTEETISEIQQIQREIADLFESIYQREIPASEYTH